MTKNNWLTCETKDGLMDIYVSGPSNAAPVVIVLQEAFGVNNHIRSICHRLSDEGFFAAAPDLFHREGRKIDVPYGERKSIMPLLGKMTNQQIIQDVRNTINFVSELPNADVKNVNTIGFCVGGFASTLAATKLDIKKMICFYGGGMVHPREGIGLQPIIKDMSSIKAKCLFFFGGQDASISHDDIGAIETKLSESKVSFEVDIFENADHGFFCDERKTYDQEASVVAWKKSLAFLRQ